MPTSHQQRTEPSERRPVPAGSPVRRPPPRPSRRAPSLRVRRRRALAVLGAVGLWVGLLIATSGGRPKKGAATAASVPSPAAVAKTGPAEQLGAGAFSPGACMALPPTAANRHKTVFLDAGHGGPDPGAQGTTAEGQAVDERGLTLPVVMDAATTLRAQGYRVVVSRTTDTSVARLGPGDLASDGSLSLQGEHDDTQARVTCANLSDAGVLVSVHFNAFSDPTAGGLLATYDDSRPFSAANQSMAQLADTDILAALHFVGWTVSDRGVLPDTTVGAPALSEEAHQYGHLLLLGPAAPGWLDHPTTMPGTLVEPLFLTDPAEASVAANPAGQRAIAAGIAEAVEAFLPEGPTAVPTT